MDVRFEIHGKVNKNSISREIDNSERSSHTQQHMFDIKSSNLSLMTSETLIPETEVLATLKRTMMRFTLDSKNENRSINVH